MKEASLGDFARRSLWHLGGRQELCTSDCEIIAVLAFRTHLPKAMVCNEVGGRRVGSGGIPG